eukprot:scaffold1853_cov367-Prasinococcus_capsulatus_cf.AAC.9
MDRVVSQQAATSPRFRRQLAPAPLRTCGGRAPGQFAGMRKSRLQLPQQEADCQQADAAHLGSPEPLFTWGIFGAKHWLA